MRISWVSSALLAFALAASSQTLVSQYCAGCHNSKLKSGNVDLSKLDLAHPDQNAQLAEKAIHMVRVGMMPPPGMPRPKPEVVASFLNTLENGVDQAAGAHPNPGRPALHRLNRTEYANSIRDLLAVDIDVAVTSPSGRHEPWFRQHGRRSHRFAGTDGRLHSRGGTDQPRSGRRCDRAGAHATPIRFRACESRRAILGTPFGTRGGIAVTHDFPADGEYVLSWASITRQPARCSD